MDRYIVEWSYDAENEDELTFEEGDIIRVLRKEVPGGDLGWWEGELNGKIGEFPDNFVKPYIEQNAKETTESIIRAQIPVLPTTKCQLCEESNIKWKCFTCEEYLCDNCKKIHRKGKATKDHKITTIDDAESGKPTVHQEKGCNKHQDEEVIMYCQECTIAICRDCISSKSHERHTLKKLEDVADLTKIIEKTKDMEADFNNKLRYFDEVQIKSSKDISGCIDLIKSRNVALKAAVDQITDQNIEEIKAIETQNHEMLKERKELATTELSKLQAILKECNGKKGCGFPDIVNFVTDSEKQLANIKRDHRKVYIQSRYLTLELREASS